MNLPVELIDSLKNIPGFSETGFSAAHNDMAVPVSVRFNPGKLVPENADLVHAEKLPWAAGAYYLQERPNFALDPHWHAGGYYVQEASSMFVAHAFKIIRQQSAGPLKVLDLCAAPGGKSTLLLNLLEESDLLVSNEVIVARNAILRENLVKWGKANALVTQNDAREIGKVMTGFFDIVLVDAPCSGSGLFRKDPAALEQWSMELVTHCSLRQERILQDIWPALKQDGFLVYSTCSFSPQENEERVEALLKDKSAIAVGLKPASDWGIREEVKKGIYSYRFFPDKVNGEGFFLSVLQKKEGCKTQFINHGRQQRIPRDIENIWKAGQFAHHGWLPYVYEEKVYAMPAQVLDAFLHYQKPLRIRKAGIELGENIHGKLQPAHDWAMSLHPPEDMPRLNLDLQNARKFLRKEVFEISFETKGWNLLTYREVPIGLAKHIGNRWNNYYPVAWRLRS